MLSDETYRQLMEMWNNLEGNNLYNTKFMTDNYMLPLIYILYPHVQDIGIINHIMMKTFEIADRRMKEFNPHKDIPFNWLYQVMMEYLKTDSKRQRYFHSLIDMMQQIKYS